MREANRSQEDGRYARITQEMGEWYPRNQQGVNTR